MDENLRREIEMLEQGIRDQKAKLTELWRRLPDDKIGEYTFETHDGAQVSLAELFGSHNDLILVHNMGKGCRYCTLWADGFTGLTKHLENRAAFVVVSKDPPNVQREFYESRGWNFRMVSSHGSTFNRDLGFETEDGGQQPGVSTFRKDDAGHIVRTAYRYFGPGDDFCAVWPMLDMLKKGADGWEPQYKYDD